MPLLQIAFYQLLIKFINRNEKVNPLFRVFFIKKRLHESKISEANFDESKINEVN